MFDKGHFDALNMLGIIATRVGNLDAAVELYGRALAVNGRSAECHFNLGQVLRAQGRNSEAMAHLGEATAIKRDYVAAHMSLADMLRLQGRLDEAAEQFRQVVALRPDYAEAYSNLGVVLAAQGRFLEAAEQYRRALSIKPEPGRHLSQSRPRPAGGRTGGRGRWQRSHAASRSAKPTKPRRCSFSAHSRRRMSLPERLFAISLPAP